MVVVKWGGELTSLGLETSEGLGHFLRERLYPGEKDGLLRLHSTFRHDFKIYTSDEGRSEHNVYVHLYVEMFVCIHFFVSDVN